MYEEILRFTLDQACEYFTDNVPKGEFVVVIQGKSLEEIEEERTRWWKNLSIEEHIKFYINEGVDKKEAIKKVAKDRKIAKSEIYRHSIEI